jgi:hypothetical protein
VIDPTLAAKGKAISERLNREHQADSPRKTGLAGSEAGGLLNRSDPPLDRVRDWLQRFICPMASRDLDLLTLWIAHTHLVDETYTTPRLLIESPVPESGKTTVLEHLERLCRHPMQMASVSSPAMITRVLQNGMRTLLIDEADRSLNPDKPGIDELIAVLNSGYKKGATRPVLVPAKGGGWETEEMPTFSPVGMAGNQPKLPEDTLSRTIRVLIMPDHESTVEDSDWELIEPEAQTIADHLVSWSDEVRDMVRHGARPELPDGAKARTKERWLPLKRVATAAGGRWPEVVDHLVELDLERMQLDREEGIVNEKPHVTLLKHVAEVWVEGETFHATEDIISMLKARFPAAWGSSTMYPNGLTAQRFGRMLVKNYGVYSDRTATKVRGYEAKSFDRAMRSVRMAPLSEPAKPVEPVEPTRVDVADEDDEPPPASVNQLRAAGLCPACERAPARTDTGVCDFCTVKSDKQAVTLQVAPSRNNIR